jgi:N-acylneuraminate cytidylyltransferase
MEVLAIIPARGGSKGVPRKNVRSLQGRPLIAHTIEQALWAQHVDRLVVSTDDPEIAQVSLETGAEVVWRPAEISGNEASSESALLHVLDHLEQKEGYIPDIIVFLQCTSPIRTGEDIDRAVHRLIEEDADSLLSVVPSHRFLWKVEEGQPRGLNYDYQERRRRQERDPEFMENGSIYVFKPWVLQETSNRLGGKISLYVMDYWSSFEIDTEDDFALCEWILARKERVSLRDALPNRIELLVLDFDGVFTDNKVIVSEDGSEAVVCDRGDGMGISRLKQAGIPVAVLSTEVNPVVAARCEKLEIPYTQGLGDAKGEALSSLLEEYGVNAEDVVYVGNDVNDLECFQRVGCAIAVADAHKDALTAADLILERRGGQGAIRELCDLLLERIGSMERENA